MKKILILIVVISLSLLMAGSAFALIASSSHDLSSYSASNEVCIFCHTPHNAFTAGTNPPLWNREAGAAITAYGSLDSTYGSSTTVPAVKATSLACMNCHDGSTGVDDYGSSGTTNTVITGVYNLGTTLVNDHPIGVDTNDSKVKAPTTTTLFASLVECASCHDVHNTASISGLLRMTNSASALCLDCHMK